MSSWPRAKPGTRRQTQTRSNNSVSRGIKWRFVVIYSVKPSSVLGAPCWLSRAAAINLSLKIIQNVNQILCVSLVMPSLQGVLTCCYHCVISVKLKNPHTSVRRFETFIFSLWNGGILSENWLRTLYKTKSYTGDIYRRRCGFTDKQIALLLLLLLLAPLTRTSRPLQCNPSAGAPLSCHFSSTLVAFCICNLQLTMECSPVGFAVPLLLLCLFLSKYKCFARNKFALILSKVCWSYVPMKNTCPVFQVSVRRPRGRKLRCQRWKWIMGWRHWHDCGQRSWRRAECSGFWKYSFGCRWLLPTFVESEVRFVVSSQNALNTKNSAITDVLLVSVETLTRRSLP